MPGHIINVRLMKILLRVFLAFIGCAASGFYSYAISLRYPAQFSGLGYLGAVFASVLIVALCFLVRRLRGWIFAIALVSAIVWHQLAWGIEAFEQFRLVGTKTWAGDGIGVILQGVTALPIFGLLLLSVVFASVIATDESPEKKTNQPSEPMRSARGSS